MNLAEKICRHPEKVNDENPKGFLAPNYTNIMYQFAQKGSIKISMI